MHIVISKNACSLYACVHIVVVMLDLASNILSQGPAATYSAASSMWTKLKCKEAKHPVICGHPLLKLYLLLGGSSLDCIAVIAERERMPLFS